VLLRAGGTYALGRAARSGAARTERVQRLVDSPRFLRAQDLVTRWGAPIVVLSFLTVGFQTLANLAAGVGKMPLRRYLPALVIGGLIWAVLYASVGLITFAALVHLYEISPVGAIVGGGVLAAGLVAYVVWQVRRNHASSAPPSTPDVVPAPKDGAEHR
jgi:membrane protein DedA with SNARE-associated domain